MLTSAIFHLRGYSLFLLPCKSSPAPWEVCFSSVCVATCSESGLPKQHRPLALVGVAQHGCPHRAGAEVLPADFLGLMCCFLQQCITRTAAGVLNLGDWQFLGNGKSNVSKQ